MTTVRSCEDPKHFRLHVPFGSFWHTYNIDRIHGCGAVQNWDHLSLCTLSTKYGPLKLKWSRILFTYFQEYMDDSVEGVQYSTTEYHITFLDFIAYCIRCTELHLWQVLA